MISVLFYKLDDFFLDIPQAKGSFQRSLAPLCCGHSSVSRCPHSSSTERFLHCSFPPLEPSRSSQTDFNRLPLERPSHVGSFCRRVYCSMPHDLQTQNFQTCRLSVCLSEGTLSWQPGTHGNGMTPSHLAQSHLCKSIFALLPCKALFGTIFSHREPGYCMPGLING